MMNEKTIVNPLLYYLPDILLRKKLHKGFRRLRYKDVCFLFIDQDKLLAEYRNRFNISISPLQLNRFFLFNSMILLDEVILSYKIYRVISPYMRVFVYGIKDKGIDKNLGHAYSVLRELGIDIESAPEYETVKCMMRMKYDESSHSKRQAFYRDFRC